MPYRILVKPKAEKDILRDPAEIRKAVYRGPGAGGRSLEPRDGSPEGRPEGLPEV